MSSSEGYVQVLPDSTGSKIRNVTVTEPIPAATPDLPDVPTSVKQQVVVLADVNGRPIDFAVLVAAITDLTEAVHEMRDLIHFVTS